MERITSSDVKCITKKIILFGTEPPLEPISTLIVNTIEPIIQQRYVVISSVHARVGARPVRVHVGTGVANGD